MKDLFLAILKLVGFLLILPLIIAFCIAFQSQILLLPANTEAPLFWGAGIYVILNLFIYDLKNVYDFGKSWIDKIMTFFKPAGYIIPIYTIFFILVYVIAMFVGREPSWQPYFLFAIAFSIAFHLVLTAHEIYESDNSLLKAHYFLTYGAILIVNLIIISLLLAWVVPEFSFVAFVKTLASQTTHLYKSIYKMLFIDNR